MRNRPGRSLGLDSAVKEGSSEQAAAWLFAELSADVTGHVDI